MVDGAHHCTCNDTVSALSFCEAEHVTATAAANEAKYIQERFVASGENSHVDSTGRIGVASRRGLQNFDIWKCDSCGCKLKLHGHASESERYLDT